MALTLRASPHVYSYMSAHARVHHSTVSSGARQLCTFVLLLVTPCQPVVSASLSGHRWRARQVPLPGACQRASKGLSHKVSWPVLCRLPCAPQQGAPIGVCDPVLAFSKSSAGSYWIQQTAGLLLYTLQSDRGCIQADKHDRYEAFIAVHRLLAPRQLVLESTDLLPSTLLAAASGRTQTDIVLQGHRFATRLSAVHCVGGCWTTSASSLRAACCCGPGL